MSLTSNASNFIIDSPNLIGAWSTVKLLSVKVRETSNNIGPLGSPLSANMTRTGTYSGIKLPLQTNSNVTEGGNVTFNLPASSYFAPIESVYMNFYNKYQANQTFTHPDTGRYYPCSNCESNLNVPYPYNTAGGTCSSPDNESGLSGLLASHHIVNSQYSGQVVSQVTTQVIPASAGTSTCAKELTILPNSSSIPKYIFNTIPYYFEGGKCFRQKYTYTYAGVTNTIESNFTRHTYLSDQITEVPDNRICNYN